jgi:hypothetical protein
LLRPGFFRFGLRSLVFFADAVSLNSANIERDY